MVETGMAGFTRGRPIDTIGQRGEGVAELFFDDVLAAAEQALEWTLAYTRDRRAFGQPISDFQAIRFALAEMATEVDVTRAYFDRSVRQLKAGRLSPASAAKAKWWATELLQRVATRCLQLHGGYGYVREYPIARLFVDARVQTIYGGTTEIMKEIVGRELISTGDRKQP